MSQGFNSMTDPGAYLEHHGIKGQKWGERRYQNEDGSWTAAGRERYGKGGVRKDPEEIIVKTMAAAMGTGLAAFYGGLIGGSTAAAVLGVSVAGLSPVVGIGSIVGIELYRSCKNKKMADVRARERLDKLGLTGDDAKEYTERRTKADENRDSIYRSTSLNMIKNTADDGIDSNVTNAVKNADMKETSVAYYPTTGYKVETTGRVDLSTFDGYDNVQVMLHSTNDVDRQQHTKVDVVKALQSISRSDIEQALLEQFYDNDYSWIDKEPGEYNNYYSSSDFLKKVKLFEIENVGPAVQLFFDDGNTHGGHLLSIEYDPYTKKATRSSIDG